MIASGIVSFTARGTKRSHISEASSHLFHVLLGSLLKAMDPFLENVFKGIKQNTQDYEENKLF